MATNVEIKRLFFPTTSTLKDIQESSRDFNVENLPPVFGEVVKWIPLIVNVFEDCKERLCSGMLDEDPVQVARPAMDVCRGKTSRLYDIFIEVIKNSNVEERYQMVANGDRLEDLMKTILNHEIQLVKNPIFANVTGTQVEDLEKALRLFKSMKASLPEDGSSYSFHNSGDGLMNVSTGTAPQNNNNSSGYQFNGPIHGFQLPR